MLTSGTRHVKKIFTIICWHELQCVLRTHCSSCRTANTDTGHAKQLPKKQDRAAFNATGTVYEQTRPTLKAEPPNLATPPGRACCVGTPKGPRDLNQPKDLACRPGLVAPAQTAPNLSHTGDRPMPCPARPSGHSR